MVMPHTACRMPHAEAACRRPRFSNAREMNMTIFATDRHGDEPNNGFVAPCQNASNYSLMFAENFGIMCKCRQLSSAAIYSLDKFSDVSRP